MSCSTCISPLNNAGLNCADCSQNVHENCGAFVASPNSEEGEPKILFVCFKCKNTIPDLSSSSISLENSSQVSVKIPKADYASSYSDTLSQIETDSKSLPKFDLKARKTIMDEFFEGENKAAANSHSWIATCKLCQRDKPPAKSRQGKLKISKGSTRTIITHLVAYHNEEFQHFCKINPHLQSTNRDLVSKTNINSLKAMHREVMHWLVHTNQDFTSLNDPYLLNLFTALQNFLPGSNTEKGFPSGDIFRKNIASLHAELEQEKIKILSSVTSKIALTIDIWTSQIQVSCIGITGHWIDADFHLQNLLLGFIPFHGPPNTATLLQLFSQVVKRYNISNKISSITLESSALHASFINELIGHQVLAQNYFTTRENFHIRCLTHVFHLMAQTLVLAYDKIMLNSEVPLQHFISLSPLNEVKLSEEGNSREDLAERPLEILRQVMASFRDNAAHRELLEKYQSCEGQEASPPPVADIQAPWNFAYRMVKWALSHKQVISTLLGNNDALAGHWSNLEEFHELLEGLDILTSSSDRPKSLSLTNSFVLLVMKDQKLDQLIQTYGETSSFGVTLCACRHMLQKYLPYFESNLHLIATVLHPKTKTLYLDSIRPNLKERALVAMTEIFEMYNTEPKIPVTKKFKPNAIASDILSSVFDHLNSHKPVIQDELKSYLALAAENVAALVYWKKHQAEYPVLSKIARDIFAIQGNSAASESSFNGGLDFKRLHYSKLTPEEYRMLKESQGMLRPIKTSNLD